MHDSQQILGIRLNAWQREVVEVRDWYQKEHRNWVPMDGQRSKWWIWNQALDEARKSVRQIQTYLQRLSEGKKDVRVGNKLFIAIVIWELTY